MPDAPGGSQPAGRVDVVLVTYNGEADLGACLASLDGEPDIAQVIIVDNASTDATVALAQAWAADRGHAVVIETGANLGFGRGANRGAAVGQAPAVLFLNPDATVEPGCVGRLADAVLGPAGSGPGDGPAGPQPTGRRVAVVGPTVRNPDGTVYPSARRFPSLGTAFGHAFLGLVAPHNRFSRSYKYPQHPDWISGTALLVRRDAFDVVGGFDERYFMYVEDVDLCRRLGDEGWGVAVVADAAVVHRIGTSSEHAPYRMILAHHRSLWQYSRTVLRGPKALALPLVGAGLAVRLVAAWAQRAIRRRPHAAP